MLRHNAPYNEQCVCCLFSSRRETTNFMQSTRAYSQSHSKFTHDLVHRKRLQELILLQHLRAQHQTLGIDTSYSSRTKRINSALFLKRIKDIALSPPFACARLNAIICYDHFFQKTKNLLMIIVKNQKKMREFNYVFA